MKEKRVSGGPAPPHPLPSSPNSGSGFFFLVVSFTTSALSSHPRASFSAVLERFPNHHGPICHFCTSLLKLKSVLSKRLSPATSLQVQWRGHRFYLWSGKIPHAAEQGSLCAPTPEAHTAGSRRSTAREAATVRSPSATVKSSLSGHEGQNHRKRVCSSDSPVQPEEIN